jgi:hypothetical protein
VEIICRLMGGWAAYREQSEMAPVKGNGEVRMKPAAETYFAWRGQYHYDKLHNLRISILHDELIWHKLFWKFAWQSFNIIDFKLLNI